MILVLGDAKPDVSGGTEQESSNPAFGDFLAILAAALYATSNVLVEAFIRDDADKVEILAHFGALGVVMSGVQSVILEGMSFTQLRVLGAKGFGYFTAYASSLFVMYTFAMDVIEQCGASAFNVSMLASDVWSVILRLIFFNGFESTGAFVAFTFSFCFVAAGICLFAYAGEPSRADAATAAPALARLKHLFASITSIERQKRPYFPMDATELNAIELEEIEDRSIQYVQNK
jgi:solute carrier family 35 protein F1/2